MNPVDRVYLTPTSIIDSDHESVQAYAWKVIGDSLNPVDRAVKLYLAVRDGIRYDPYSPFYLPDHYRASNILIRGRSYCVPKASLLCALGRSCGVPSRIGFATVRNHLTTRQLLDFMGSDLFVYHGFVEFYLEGKWVKATPAFNRELCLRHQVAPLEFDGHKDSLFQPYNLQRQKFMEYVEYHGTYPDVPVETIVSAWKRTYGKDRVQRWIRMFKEHGKISLGEFDREDIVTE